MKMNCKLKALAVAAIMAASAPAFAAIDGAASGNGELLLNMRYYGGDSAHLWPSMWRSQNWMHLMPHPQDDL